MPTDMDSKLQRKQFGFWILIKLALVGCFSSWSLPSLWMTLIVNGEAMSLVESGAVFRLWEEAHRPIVCRICWKMEKRKWSYTPAINGLQSTILIIVWNDKRIMQHWTPDSSILNIFNIIHPFNKKIYINISHNLICKKIFKKITFYKDALFFMITTLKR